LIWLRPREAKAWSSSWVCVATIGGAEKAVDSYEHLTAHVLSSSEREEGNEMSNRSLTAESRTIHPRALTALGEKACLVMLGECCTSCCIAGHVVRRLGIGLGDLVYTPAAWADAALQNRSGGLFGATHPSDPQLAARAIERYIYEGADDPWGDN
jgi:hypothetical protein